MKPLQVKHLRELLRTPGITDETEIVVHVGGPAAGVLFERVEPEVVPLSPDPEGRKRIDLRVAQSRSVFIDD